MPQMREIAKRLIKDGEDEEFMRELPHKYYEENIIHAIVISDISDYDECIKQLERFLPYVDNWACCDSIRPKCFRREHDKLGEYLLGVIDSEHNYTVRFGIEMLMVHFLDADYSKKYSDKVASIVSNDYYVNMMIAWYFATALAKQYDDAVKYIENNSLSHWVHNKTISKAHDSYRISDERKEYLQSFRLK